MADATPKQDPFETAIRAYVESQRQYWNTVDVDALIAAKAIPSTVIGGGCVGTVGSVGYGGQKLINPPPGCMGTMGTAASGGGCVGTVGTWGCSG